MCRKCREPIFPFLSTKTEQRIGAAVYWLTSPLWGAVCLALWLVTLPLRLVVAGLAYGSNRTDSDT